MSGKTYPWIDLMAASGLIIYKNMKNAKINDFSVKETQNSWNHSRLADQNPDTSESTVQIITIKVIQ